MWYTAFEVIEMSSKLTITDIITINNFLSGLSQLFKTEMPSKDDEDLIVSSIGGIRRLKLDIPMREIKEKLNSVRGNLECINDTCIFNKRDNCFEKTVEPTYFDTINHQFNRTITALSTELFQTSLSYMNEKLHMKIGRASSEMVLFLLCYIGQTKKTIEFSCVCEKDIELKSIDDLSSYLTFQSLKVFKSSSEPIERRYADFYAYLLLYMLAKKQYGTYIDRVTKIECSKPPETIISDNEIQDIYLPLQFKIDPVRYYLQAFSVSHPAMRFLSFYHVLEFQYSSIQEKEAILFLSVFLKDKTINMTLAKEIYSKMIFYADKKTERDQLYLCLLHNIPESDLSSLFDRIEELGGMEILQYYQENAASFATGVDTKINRNQTKLLDKKGALSKTAYEYTLEKITERIYSIRNFFVHSKESDERKKSSTNYIPFEHDVLLLKELPLIQALSEMFIEKDAVKRNYTEVL